MVPVTLAEPLKMVAVIVAGKGHWLFGTAMAVAAYGVSLLIVERLFKIVKPKLLMLPWFSTIWAVFVQIRNAATSVFSSAKGRS
jgi:hypothetical protein